MADSGVMRLWGRREQAQTKSARAGETISREKQGVRKGVRNSKMENSGDKWRNAEGRHRRRGGSSGNTEAEKSGALRKVQEGRWGQSMRPRVKAGGTKRH